MTRDKLQEQGKSGELNLMRTMLEEHPDKTIQAVETKIENITKQLCEEITSNDGRKWAFWAHRCTV